MRTVLALALLLITTAASASPLPDFTYNGKTYTADTDALELWADSGLTAREWSGQRERLMDAVEGQLSRTYRRGGWPATNAKVYLGTKYHPLLAYRVAWEYSQLNWQAGLFEDADGMYVAVWWAEFAE